VRLPVCAEAKRPQQAACEDGPFDFAIVGPVPDLDDIAFMNGALEFLRRTGQVLLLDVVARDGLIRLKRA
jgi:hypothetical protein